MAYTVATREGHSSMASSSEGGLQQKYCKCNFRARFATAWSRDNAGRRYFTCDNAKVKECGFFEWYNADLPMRISHIIDGLKTTEQQLRKEINVLEKDNARFKNQLLFMGVMEDEIDVWGFNKGQSGKKIRTSVAESSPGTQSPESTVDRLEEVHLLRSELRRMQNKYNKVKAIATSSQRGLKVYRFLFLVASIWCIWNLMIR